MSIQIWHEPDGPGTASTQWKHLFDVKTDEYGIFGFTQSGGFYPVRRSICGHPTQSQFMVFMAKNLDTGKIQMRQVFPDLSYTGSPC